MSLTVYVVDAFTDQPFAGNPAGVCLLPAAISEERMQSVAAELNLSETAFLYPESTGYHLRWFTPKAEVRLCGHATLASAHILWETKAVNRATTIQFRTLSGELRAARRNDLIELDFPRRNSAPAQVPEGLLEALGCPAVWAGKNIDDYLIELTDQTNVQRCAPDFRAISKLPVRGVIVTARSADPKFDFVSRFFAPAVGVNEDPVTGSAHCALAPYWGGKLGKSLMTGRQLSARGGTVHVRLDGDRVMLGGTAITVMRAELFV